jgi:mRNA interferase MazF
MEVVVRRFDVFLIRLDPTVGREMRKTRPCVVISPDEMNRHLSTILVAPMTTAGQPYPTRIPCRFRGKDGSVALDQVRAVDRSRLIRRLGRLGAATQDRILATLAELFAR